MVLLLLVVWVFCGLSYQLFVFFVSACCKNHLQHDIELCWNVTSGCARSVLISQNYRLGMTNKKQNYQQTVSV